MRRALAAVAVFGLLLTGRSPAASQYPSVLSGTLNAACATYTGCSSASVLPTTISPPPATVTLQVAGTFSGTLVLEASIDCKNYVAETLTPSSGGTAVSSFTMTGLWTGVISGVTCLQVRMSSYSSGTANVTLLINSIALAGYSQYCIACGALGQVVRLGSATSVAADGGSTSVSFTSAFAGSISGVVVTPTAYSGSDNAAISCRVTTETLTGFTCICGGGQSASTVTLYYVAQGA